MATYRFGDVNGDGVVDVYDAVLIFNYVAGNYHLTPDEMIRADMELDGVITAVDARKIIQHFAGVNLIYDTLVL